MKRIRFLAAIILVPLVAAFLLVAGLYLMENRPEDGDGPEDVETSPVKNSSHQFPEARTDKNSSKRPPGDHSRTALSMERKVSIEPLEGKKEPKKALKSMVESEDFPAELKDQEILILLYHGPEKEAFLTISDLRQQDFAKLEVTGLRNPNPITDRSQVVNSSSAVIKLKNGSAGAGILLGEKIEIIIHPRFRSDTSLEWYIVSGGEYLEKIPLDERTPLNLSESDP